MREMKDSGIEWIGEIPKEWEIAKLKNVCTRIIVGLATSVTQYYQDDGIPMFRNLNIKETGLDTEDVLFLNPEWAEKQEGKKIHTDDILTVHTGYIGISCLVPKDYDDCLTFTTLISTVDNKYAIPKYINYWINISRFFSLIYKSVDTGAQINLNIAEFVNLETVVPPLLVQQSVVNYLDEKCTKIDAIIEKQQEIIERLKEYKLSIISEAVTKGLNPDAEMKDSGVEWIGKTPKSWKCVISRFVFENVGDINHYMPDSVEKGYPYLMIGDLKDASSEIHFESCKKISEADFNVLREKMQPQNGDVIFARYATIGTVCYVDTDNDFLVSYACVTVKPDRRNLNGKYLFYYFKSNAFLEEVKQFINSNTQGNVGIEALYKTKITVPELEEQGAIVNYLDNKCSQIDSTIGNRLKAIKSLEQYKKSLIYEVVTGKREV